MDGLSWTTIIEPAEPHAGRRGLALDHHEGFEVVGITDDTDKAKLERFLKANGNVWPQYFGGQVYNKFIVEFGINSFPHMFLVGRKGCLRYDDVVAYGSRTNFEDKIEHLLAEKGTPKMSPNTALEPTPTAP